MIFTLLKHNKPLLGLIAAVAVLALVPVAMIIFLVGRNWQGVAPSYEGSYYYYARLREVQDGYKFLGNPFFIEHRQELAPAFFLADWLAAWPLLLGFSLNAAAIFDFIFWSLIFAAGFYFVLQQLGLPPRLRALGSFLSYLAVYSLLFRPVSMQTVFPFFIIFLLAFIFWLKQPSNKRRLVFLTAATALSFYIYTYLWQIVAVAMVLHIIYFWFAKRRQEAKYLAASFAAAIILAVPFAAYTIKQLAHPYYWQTMERIGLVYTHWPAGLVFYSAGWILAMLALWFLAWRVFKVLPDKDNYKKIFIFFGLIGLSLMIVSGSNVITGKELENAQHIERFIVVWFILAFITWLFYAYREWGHWKNFPRLQKISLSFLVLVCLVGFISYLRQGPVFLNMWRDFKKNAVASQEYARPLRWLEANEPAPKVVWTNSEDLTNYITVLSKHYVLFVMSGILHLLPNQEAADRYLVSRYFNDLRKTDIERDYLVFSGVGNAFHKPNSHNRQVRLCRVFHFYSATGKANCGAIIPNAAAFAGERYFDDLYQRYRADIKPNIAVKLRQYHVDYLVRDVFGERNFAPEKLPGATLVYSDKRFFIYKLNPPGK